MVCFINSITRYIFMLKNGRRALELLKLAQTKQYSQRHRLIIIQAVRSPTNQQLPNNHLMN